MSSRLEDLQRMREVAFLALDGNRRLQRAAKDGEESTFDEPAVGLLNALRPIIREIDELIGGDAEEVPTVDEIAARRKARLAGADDPAQSSRRSQPRRRGRGDSAS